jgi:hypothetical protein
MRLLAREVLNNTADVTFALPAGFDKFTLVADSITNASIFSLRGRISTDGGSNYIATGYISAAFYAIGITHNHMSSLSTEYMGMLWFGAGEVPRTGISSICELTGHKAGQYFRSNSYSAGYGPVYWVLVLGSSQYSGSTDLVTHLKLLPEGNFTTGTLYLYGE